MPKYAGVLALVLLAVTPISFARKDETLDQLIARADSAKIDQQPDLYTEIADREMKALADSFKAEHWDEFRADLQQVVNYCDRAQVTAIQSKKRIKRTEIRIREISKRLRDMKLDVEPDDQPTVQAAVDRLEHFRADLLRSMFDLKDDHD